MLSIDDGYHLYRDTQHNTTIMKYKTLKAAKILLFCAMANITSAAIDNIGTEYIDVTYKTVDGVDLKLDIYRPDTNATTPVVIYTHGGGWVTGDKGSAAVGYKSTVISNLLEQGVSVVSVQYRYASNGNVMADCVIDAKDACRFMTQNASTYNINKDQMATFGDSAGAHIAMLVALSGNTYIAFEGDSSLSSYSNYQIVGCAAWYGPVSFRTQFNEDEFWTLGGRFLSGFGTRIFGTETDSSAITAAQVIVSPTRYYDASSVPLTLVHGNMDTTIPIYHMYGMMDLAATVGNSDFASLEIENAGHNFLSANGEAISPTANEIIEYTTDRIMSSFD